MTERTACYRLSHCPADGARPCPGCTARPAAVPRTGQQTGQQTAPRMTLAEDAVMAMAASVTFATVFIAVAFWLA
ncbi:hypothetical protein [Paragemmobacter ruber]|uniref:Uncharacterized protein n=1 Tax=Paragemmobacter ruber TaxID=1985673 RepID=A0ABW9Y1S2_9RHOB|nr:hypothetical protein [Rhodobacter ruber]NBE06179.1 hypothetical protein [Rhodobacter ruber]